MISVIYTGTSVLIIYFIIKRKIVQLCTSHTKLSQMSPQATCPSCLARCALFRLIGYPPISSYRLSPLYTMHRRGYPSIPYKLCLSAQKAPVGQAILSNMQVKREPLLKVGTWKPPMFQTLPNDYIHQIL